MGKIRAIIILVLGELGGMGIKALSNNVECFLRLQTHVVDFGRELVTLAFHLNDDNLVIHSIRRCLA